MPRARRIIAAMAPEVSGFERPRPDGFGLCLGRCRGFRRELEQALGDLFGGFGDEGVFLVDDPPAALVDEPFPPGVHVAEPLAGDVERAGRRCRRRWAGARLGV